MLSELSRAVRLCCVALAVLWVSMVATALPAQAQEIWALEDDLILEPAPISDLPAGWLTSFGPGVEVHGPGRLLSLLDDLAAHGGRRVGELAGELKVPLGGTLHVYVTEDTEQFASLQPGRPPEWADGTAWPRRGLIFLRAPRARGPGQRPLKVVLDHELVHILLGRAFHPQTPPSWLQEGYAQVFAGEFGMDQMRSLQLAHAQGAVMSLSQITKGFPADAMRARTAYAASAHLVSWLGQTYGEDTVVDVTRRMARGASVEQALERATGETLSGLESEWRASLPQGIERWLALGSEEVLFGIGALMALVLGAYRWRTQRARIAGWREERTALVGLAQSMLWRRSVGDAWTEPPSSPSSP